MGNENFKKRLLSCHDIQAYVCSSAGVGRGKKKKCIDTAFKNRPKAADPSDDWTDAQRGVLKLEYAQPPAAVKLVPQ